jgi:transcriptional regulator with XRE-family HTH domain
LTYSAIFNLEPLAVFVKGLGPQNGRLRAVSSSNLRSTVLKRLLERIPERRQKRVAQFAGMNESTISRWKNGKEPFNPTLESLERLAEAVRTPVADLIIETPGHDQERHLTSAPAPEPEEFLKIRLKCPHCNGAIKMSCDLGENVGEAPNVTKERA